MLALSLEEGDCSMEMLVREGQIGGIISKFSVTKLF